MELVILIALVVMYILIRFFVWYGRPKKYPPVPRLTESEIAEANKQYGGHEEGDSLAQE